METERIALSQKEQDRLQVLRELEQGRFRQVAAAQLRPACPLRCFERLERGRAQSGCAHLGASTFFAAFFFVSSMPFLHCVCTGPFVAHFVKEAIASAKSLVDSCARPSNK
jgi:hypothetical protein